MLVQFTVGNFLSFREKTTFSMVASPDEPGHEDRVITVSDNLRLLRIAAIYGANASGKSNLLKAMEFASALVIEGTRGTKPILTQPFCLAPATLAQPSHFEFIYYWKQKLFCFGFTCDTQRIHSEWFRDASTDESYFERIGDSLTFAPNIEALLNSDEETPKTSRERLQFVSEGTRPNQLFLTEAVERNIQLFTQLAFWFQVNPALISAHLKRPDSLLTLLQRNPERLQALGEFLKIADTGIEGVTVHDEEESLSLRAQHGQDKILLRPESESEGTQRLMDLWLSTMLFPKFDKVLVLDEIDRSLHPELARFFLQEWGKQAPEQSQLIFTTHNDNLLEDDLLRRDEVWLVTKNREGASELTSLIEYKIAPNTNLQKAYLHGWFNGVPRLGPRRFYHTIREEENDAHSSS